VQDRDWLSWVPSLWLKRTKSRWGILDFVPVKDARVLGSKQGAPVLGSRDTTGRVRALPGPSQHIPSSAVIIRQRSCHCQGGLANQTGFWERYFLPYLILVVKHVPAQSFSTKSYITLTTSGPACQVLCYAHKHRANDSAGVEPVT
jgi:hypothetical protein